ncbi:MAG: hypothetical protein V5A72_02130, partial [Candidatus Nanohaloarchaea archaeon]
ALGGFMDYAANELPEDKIPKVELLRFARSLEPEDHMEIGVLMDYFKEEGIDPVYVDGPVPEVSERTLEEYWGEIGDEHWTGDEILTKGFALDIVKTLQSQALNKEDTEKFVEEVKEYELFFSRCRPDRSNLLEDGSDYTVVPVSTAEGVKALGYSTPGSCLLDNPEKHGFKSYQGMFRDHPYQEAFDMWHRDPGTIYHAIGKDRDLHGYVRSFILEDFDGKNFAGIDTVEVPKSGGLEVEQVAGDFEERSDVISAGVLGAAAMFISLGLDYVAGKEGRIKYGPRDAFGNTRKPIEYRKLGDTVPYYSAYKGDEWQGPGWRGYHEEGEADIRGFRTESGWHSTENAYILMEHPDNLPYLE